MKKVLCFGEILLRLSPDVQGNWLEKEAMPVYMGGAELNVAQALARWQVPVAYCSAMPENYLSKKIKDQLTANGVDVSRMITCGDRIGIYYLAQGTDLKHAEVIYDRAASSTAALKPGQVNWDEIFEGISWFHFSAISPAINEDLANVCLEALQTATRKNIFISVDLNYRSKLWKWGKIPREVMPELVKYCDLVMGNIWAAERMLGTPLDENLLTGKEGYLKQARNSSEQIIKDFPKCRYVANTFRFDRDNDLQYYGTFYDNGKLYVSNEHIVTDVVDKVGSGDCFMAGLVYGQSNALSAQETIDFAAAAAVDKMHIVGDATRSGVNEIKQRLNKNMVS